MSDLLLRVQDLRTTFATERGPLVAVDGVDLVLERGRTLGIVGESGSGKSVLSRTIMGLTTLDPGATTTGSVLLGGEELLGRTRSQLRSIWGQRIGMVFQDPMTSLNPTMKIGRQIGEVLQTVHGSAGRRALRQRAAELLQAVGIPSPMHRLKQYPHELSGGMRQRIVIAIALANEPELLIADEPTTALDVTIQAQILELLVRLQAERGMALILVTHDLGVAAAFTDHVAVMYAGQVVEQAPTDELFAAMRMPYTEALFRSIPSLDAPPHARLHAIDGVPPDLTARFRGCRFAPRCDRVEADCAAQLPPLVHSGGARAHRCWHPIEELRWPG